MAATDNSEDVLMGDLVVPSSSAEENNNDPTIRESRKRRKPTQNTRDLELMQQQMKSVQTITTTTDEEKVWTENEQVILLQVLMKRTNKSDMKRLYQYATKHLDNKFSEEEITEKVNRLKTNFIDNISSHDSLIRDLCQEIWGDQESETADDDMMTKQSFFDRYPLIAESIRDLAPYDTISGQGKGVLTTLISSLPQKELQEMEDEWVIHDRKQAERQETRFHLYKKLSQLLQMGTTAHDQQFN